MKKRLLQLVLILLMPIVCSAEKYVHLEIGGVKYFIEDTDYIGAELSGFTSKTVTIPEKITYKGNDYSVFRRYGINSCTGFDNLESLTSKIKIEADFTSHPTIKTVTMPIPNEIRFSYCEKLESVTFTTLSNESSGSIDLWYTPFRCCAKLEKVTFPSNIKVAIREEAFSWCTSLKSVSIPQITLIGTNAFLSCTSLTSIDLTNSLEGIGEGAFSDCTSLASINIPNSVTSIGNNSFIRCTSLKKISIANGAASIGNGAFYGCTSLKEITIPKSVKTIGGSAFGNCTSLASINGGGYKWNSVMLPMGLETIGYAAFQGCTSLGMVNIPNSVATIGDNAFMDCTGIESAYISNKATTIGKEAFKNCSSLKEISIPNSVTTIGNDLFYNCTSLVSAKLSSSLTTTGTRIFYGCTNLTSVEIPEGLEIIGEYVFYGCSSLATVEIPNSVTTIENYAFHHSGLTSIEMPNSITTIGKDAFSDCTSLVSAKLSSGLTTTGEYTFYGCTNLSSVDIPNNVKTIGYKSFQGCTSLVSIKIPDSVTKIEACAFSLCNNLKTMNSLEIEQRLNLDVVNIPTNVEEIEASAFYGCNAMQYLSLPNSLTSIGNNAFWGCDNLLIVVSKIQIPFAIPYNVFLCKKDGDIHAFLYVPMGTYTDYKNCEGWKLFDPNIGVYGDADLPIPGKPGGHDDNVSITANNYTIKYGDELPTFEYTSSGTTLYGTPEITCEATKTSPVGTYPIVVAKGSVTNARTTFVNGTLTITKAPLTIKAGNYTKVEGEDNPEFTLSYEGFKNNETAAVLTKQPTVSCSASKDSPAGSYPVTVSGAEAQNYEISYVSGTLNVTEAGSVNPDDIITFADAKVKAICVENWDTNNDGELSKAEAAAVTDLGTLFRGKHIGSFEEIKYFTGVTSLVDEAFYWNTSLGSFTIPAFITNIGKRVFAENYINNLSVEAGNPVYDSRDNCNAIVETATNKLIAACDKSFIPASVTAIGEGAFSGCLGLTDFDIPITVSSIEAEAFHDCRRLESVTVHHTTPLAIDEDCFTWWDQDNGVYQKPRATLYVPAGTKSLYRQADGWKDFSDIVETGVVEKYDLTGDGEVNGTDLVVLVEAIMSESANASADLNGDGETNGTDLVILVEIIMSVEPSANNAAARGDATASLTRIEVEAEPYATDESRTLDILLSNPDMDVTMVQMDMHLPKGLTLCTDDDNVEMAERTSWRSHSIYTRSLDNNTVRLMLASNRNVLIDGTGGALLRLHLTADPAFEGSDITFDNMLCTSPSLEEARPKVVTVRLAANGTTGIRTDRDAGQTDDEWYNMQGLRVKKPGKGLYIRNGRKVVIK